jgi:hypothetical protein
LASLAAVSGNYERAARLYGAAEAFCDTVGVACPDSRDDVIAHGELTARAALGDDTYAAALARGRRWSPDEAVAEALADERKSLTRQPRFAPEPHPARSGSSRKPSATPAKTPLELFWNHRFLPCAQRVTTGHSPR